MARPLRDGHFFLNGRAIEGGGDRGGRPCHIALLVQKEEKSCQNPFSSILRRSGFEINYLDQKKQRWMHLKGPLALYYTIDVLVIKTCIFLVRKLRKESTFSFRPLHAVIKYNGVVVMSEGRGADLIIGG